MEIHVYDRRKIMARAWEISRQRRADAARRIYDAETTVVCGRIYQPRQLSEILASLPIDMSTALSLSWSEARQGVVPHMASIPPQRGALAILRPGRIAPLRRRIRSRLWPALAAAVRWVERHFIRTAA